jgi:hypothetical protein
MNNWLKCAVAANRKLVAVVQPQQKKLLNDLNENWKTLLTAPLAKVNQPEMILAS